MLSSEEKAYCRALEALRIHDFGTARAEFDRCAAFFSDSRGMKILSEATRLLAVIEEEKNDLKGKNTLVKEIDCHGQETIICRQGLEKEADRHLPGM